MIITIITIISLFIVIFSVKKILDITFFSSENIINEVSFSKESVQQFDNPSLYKYIKKGLMGQNFMVFKYIKLDEFIKQIKNKYTIIQDINIYKSSNQRAIVEIVYKKPTIVFSDGISNYGVIEDNFIEIFSGSQILSGKRKIKLPEYVSDFNSMTGFFYNISADKLAEQISYIEEYYANDIQEMKYLPGGSKTIIFTNEGKRIFFDNTKDIANQINKYNLLQNIYTGFDNVGEIDLGSLEGVIIKEFTE